MQSIAAVDILSFRHFKARGVVEKQDDESSALTEQPLLQCIDEEAGHFFFLISPCSSLLLIGMAPLVSFRVTLTR
jgi:hypothetical protein